MITTKEVKTSNGTTVVVKLPMPLSAEEHFLTFTDKATGKEIIKIDMNYLIFLPELMNGNFTDAE